MPRRPHQFAEGKHTLQLLTEGNTRGSARCQAATAQQSVVSDDRPIAAIVDLSNYVFRFHYAFHNRLSAEAEVDTSIVHSLLKYVLHLVGGRHLTQWGKPTQLIIAMDGGPGDGGVSTRRQLFPAYKANREQTPKDVRDAFKVLPNVLHSMGMNVVMVPGIEADDIIATLTTQLRERGSRVGIYSGDKDFRQLLAPDVCLVRNQAIETEDTFLATFAFAPSLFVDYQALVGDAADNIPGVPKIGDKRARTLVQTYGPLEEIYGALDSMKEGVVKNALAESGIEHARMMRELVTLQTDVAIHHTLPLLDSLPYGPDNMLRPSRAGTENVELFCDAMQLKVVKQLFQQLAALETR